MGFLFTTRISSWPIVDQSLGWRSLVIDRLSPSFFRPTRILVFGEFFLFDPMPYPSCVHDTGPGYIFHKNKVRLRGLIGCSFCNLHLYLHSFISTSSTSKTDIGWGFNRASGDYPTCGQLWYTQLLLFTSLFDRSGRRSLSNWHLKSSGRVGKQPLRPTSS